MAARRWARGWGGGGGRAAVSTARSEGRRVVRCAWALQAPQLIRAVHCVTVALQCAFLSILRPAAQADEYAEKQASLSPEEKHAADQAAKKAKASDDLDNLLMA